VLSHVYISKNGALPYIDICISTKEPYVSAIEPCTPRMGALTYVSVIQSCAASPLVSHKMCLQKSPISVPTSSISLPKSPMCLQKSPVFQERMPSHKSQSSSVARLGRWSPQKSVCKRALQKSPMCLQKSPIFPKGRPSYISVIQRRAASPLVSSKTHEHDCCDDGATRPLMKSSRPVPVTPLPVRTGRIRCVAVCCCVVLCGAVCCRL